MPETKQLATLDRRKISSAALWYYHRVPATRSMQGREQQARHFLQFPRETQLPVELGARQVEDGCSWPDANRMPRAMGRSNRPPSFGRSAGARLTVMRPRGHLIPAMRERGPHPLATFLHCWRGQADDSEGRQATAYMDLDPDLRRDQACLRAAQYFGEPHAPRVCLSGARPTRWLSAGFSQLQPLIAFQSGNPRFECGDQLATAFEYPSLRLELFARHEIEAARGITQHSPGMGLHNLHERPARTQGGLPSGALPELRHQVFPSYD